MEPEFPKSPSRSVHAQRVMRSKLVLVSLLLLAGCGGPVHEPVDDGSSSTPSTISGPPEAEALLDEYWNYTNQAPQPFAVNVDVTEYNLSANFASLNVTVTQVQKPQVEAFGDNVKVSGPGNVSEKRAFSQGVALFSFSEPSQGQWTLSFGTDQFQPAGKHQLHIQMWGVR